ncbi:tetratricopeptide repeat protein [Ramlibacter henchirensis]|uniref:Tetratricopeptide repeat protein n=1 Tax=Ramlibacter henchirensis TaxID=204072 RepID=A0A4Z0C9H8_9BURK|nr:tetratricopeptide repeat protein [Ramlibacter henchirensis]TFZ07060.1 tetratricopeptide repeat protein [Ramlibacter henchirensis]
MDARFEQAKAFFLHGLDHYRAGRFEAADREFSAALSLVPGRPSTLTNLGATRLKLGKVEEAAALLQEALKQEPDNAEALGHLAAALAEMGRRDEALAAVTRAVALSPDNAAAWGLRGTLARELGRREEAAEAFREAMAHGADRQLMSYYLAGVAQESAPPAPPRQYVEQLFDSYAQDFEQHLAGTLQYRGPEILVEGLAQPRFRAALDLGCGTGLVAPLLRPRCERLDGIDLSAAMVERARASGLYDNVVQGDIAEFLAATGKRYDLLIAGDVFVYVGALESVFDGAARVLDAGGAFCFSLEAADEQETFALRMSLRYAHSERYIRMLAAQRGFDLESTVRHPLRIDQGRPVAGLFAWLRKPGAPS